jgi:hypothetical protein
MIGTHNLICSDEQNSSKKFINPKINNSSLRKDAKKINQQALEHFQAFLSNDF